MQLSGFIGSLKIATTLSRNLRGVVKEMKMFKSLVPITLATDFSVTMGETIKQNEVKCLKVI